MFKITESKTYPIGLHQLRSYKFADGLLSFAGPEGHSTGPSKDRFSHQKEWYCRRRLGGFFYSSHMCDAILSCLVCSHVKTRKEFLWNMSAVARVLARDFSHSAGLSRQFIMAASSAQSVIGGNKPIVLIEALVGTFRGK